MKITWILLGMLWSVSLLAGAVSPEKSSSEKSGRKWPTLTGEPTLLVAHRGESVLLPPNSLESYELAAVEGADFVEPDLVLTKDGILVCYHALTLKGRTDVDNRPEFARLQTNFTGVLEVENKTIVNNWFVKDFTLAELKTLNVKQTNIGARPQLVKQRFEIPTFQEYLDTLHQTAWRLNKSIGIIPELKSPKFHNDLYPQTPYFMEELFLRILTENGYPLTSTATPSCKSRLDQNASISCGRLIIQSAETNCLKYLGTRTSVDKMILIEAPLFPLLTHKGLQDVSKFVTHYSLWKELLYTGILAQIEKDGIQYDKKLVAEMGGFIPPGWIVSEAHSLGLKVGIFTIFDSREPSLRGCTVKCDKENKTAELFYYFDKGVDCMFVENVQEARELRIKYEYEVVRRIGSFEKPIGKQFDEHPEQPGILSRVSRLFQM